jgi:hypothetical protein
MENAWAAPEGVADLVWSLGFAHRASQGAL